MSKKHPECPLYNPTNCKDHYNPNLCAIVREDKECLKKKGKPRGKFKKKDGNDWVEWTVSDEVRESI